MRPPLARVTVAVSLALLLAGCGGPTSGPRSAAGSEPTPSHVEVVRLQVVGGFAARPDQRKAPPRLVVYADGRAVADGKRTVHLGHGQLDSLLSGLRRDLDGLPPTVSPHGVAISDASTVSISVRSDNGSRQTVTAKGLSAFPQAFPDRLAHAWKTLAALTSRVQSGG